MKFWFLWGIDALIATVVLLILAVPGLLYALFFLVLLLTNPRWN